MNQRETNGDIIIGNVSPQLDGGRFPVKRVLGDSLSVEADIFTRISGGKFSAVLKYRHETDSDWSETTLEQMSNDRWKGSFAVDKLGRYNYTIETQDAANGKHFSHRILDVIVDPVLAQFGAWYEVFPRSCSSEPGCHGTLRDLADRLPHIASMGFDVVYMPPIHPIGRTARKGKNNSLIAQPGDPGCPWAIGAAEGGHKTIHPELGTIDDFHFLLRRANGLGIEIALDIAFQCSPDHPYIQSHPEWFQWRDDGTIAHAEDPPNRFEDVVPFHFRTTEWRSLWCELRSIFEFWVEQGVRVFRVDNPHTKPFSFWEWVISELKQRWPELIFLSEGLTRPKLMTHLAKLGFTQSYDYFPWRNGKAELTDYYASLATGEMREYFRPNLWPNTPQNLPPYLQHGGRPAFIVRLILAATLGASYGIYGPPFEICENRAIAPESVDYLDSEQYELKCWNWAAPGNLCDLVARLNEIRRENAALQANDTLWFHSVDNERLIAYSKTMDDCQNVVLTIVNLDPCNKQGGWLSLTLDRLGLNPQDAFTARDLVCDEQYTWHGRRNFVELDPFRIPAHILRLERR